MLCVCKVMLNFRCNKSPKLASNNIWIWIERNFLSYEISLGLCNYKSEHFYGSKVLFSIIYHHRKEKKGVCYTIIFHIGWILRFMHRVQKKITMLLQSKSSSSRKSVIVRLGYKNASQAPQASRVENIKVGIWQLQRIT